MNVSEDTDLLSVEVSIPRWIKFWFLLVLDIPAVLYTIYLLYRIISIRNLRELLHNHVIFVLLVISLVSQLTGVCFYIVYSKTDQVWLANPFFCNFWQFIDIGLFDMIGILLAYAAIERHILIFHNSLVNTRRKRLIFHYIPLSLTIIYGLFVYIILIFFPSCENLYDYTQSLCGSACYFSVYNLVIYDTTVNCIFPVVLMIIFNLTLIIRHIRQKQRINQQIQWHKHRKMIFQLLSITLLLLIFYLPICILMMINCIIILTELGYLIQLYLYFFAYLVVLLMPFVCSPSISNYSMKFFYRLIKFKTRSIIPIE